jgi:pimeloyl-ACP methyl ester carboxylesterase
MQTVVTYATNLLDTEIHFYVRGNTKQYLICFYGYGQNATVFDELAAYLKDTHTLLIVDLPFHGANMHNKGFEWTAAHTNALTTYFKKQFNIESYSLLAYSIGARIALSIFEQDFTAIEKIYLLAPDGVFNSRFFKFITRNRLGKGLMYSFIHFPHIVFGIINLLAFTHILDAASKRLYMSTTHSQLKRRRLANFWNCVHQLNLSKELKSYLLQFPTAQEKILLFYGIHDPIINKKQLLKSLDAFSNIQKNPLPCGHNIFNPAIFPIVLKKAFS